MRLVASDGRFELRFDAEEADAMSPPEMFQRAAEEADRLGEPVQYRRPDGGVEVAWPRGGE